MSKLTERILFLKFVHILKFVKIRELQEFLKFIKFEFSIYASMWVKSGEGKVNVHFLYRLARSLLDDLISEPREALGSGI